ncbi:CTD small phosphatase-like protein 2-B [Bienertia sinuspersici]
MQTKKRVSSKSTGREPASTRTLRSQKKVSENVQVKKKAEFITSSARKSTYGERTDDEVENGEKAEDGLSDREGMVVSGRAVAKKDVDSATISLTSTYTLLQDDVCSVSLVSDEVSNGSTVLNERNEGNAHCDSGTIFSPSFHLSKSVEEDIGDADTNEACMSSEVSAIYLAMKNSKLECLDEYEKDSVMVEASTEEEEYEEYDDFDPYFFIKNLPELSTVVPTFRQMLLPKQTRRCPPTTLVLDLDETLVHSSLEPCDDADFTFTVNFNQKDHTVYVRCRPHLQDFMERVASLFEIIIFTASQSIYAEQLLNVLDPKRRIFRHRVYRESCVFVDGNYLKDLSVLGRDLSRVAIIDNSPQAFGFQVDNGIPIESWFDDRSDQELLLLLPFLEGLVGADDVRPLIAEKFNLRDRVAAAVYPSSNSNRGDPFDR